MDVNFTATTAGNGFWNRVPNRCVKIIRLEMPYVADDERFGELVAYFDPAGWKVDRDGLIYTDSGWFAEFCDKMLMLGFSMDAVECIAYSEQGMQRDDYVSFDVSEEFIEEWAAMTKQKGLNDNPD